MIRQRVFTLMLVLLVTLFSFSNTSLATVVVGLVHKDGTVYIGADSAGTSKHLITILAEPKVFKKINDQMIIGFTGSVRMGQILEHECEIKEQTDEPDIMTYMSAVFIKTVRECFKKGGFAEKIDERETGGLFLVGYKGKLFRVGSNYSVVESKIPYLAIGSGDALALGSLHTSAYYEYIPEQRVLMALLAAAQSNTTVSDPFWYVVLPADK